MKKLITILAVCLMSIVSMAGNGKDGISPTKRVFEKWQKTFVLYPKKSLHIKKPGLKKPGFDK